MKIQYYDLQDAINQIDKVFSELASTHRTQARLAKRKTIATENSIKANTYENACQILKRLELIKEQPEIPGTFIGTDPHSEDMK